MTRSSLQRACIRAYDLDNYSVDHPSKPCSRRYIQMHEYYTIVTWRN